MPDLIKNLKGHSGCQVQLLRFDDLYLVRKTSASQNYNPRLLRQIEKQQRLESLVAVPRVIKVTTSDELVSFDMEYVAGRDLTAQCLQEPAGWILGFTDQLLDLLGTLSGAPLAGDLTDSFTRKIQEIDAKLATHPHALKRRSALDGVIETLLQADWSGIPRTECHGDLTLENIIFKSDGSLVFIDTLDGDLETVWLDIAKLLFDLEIGWTLRHVLWTDSAPAQGGRLLDIFSRYLREEVEMRLNEKYLDLTPRLPQFKMLQAMRILPYTNDPATFDRLVAYVKTIDSFGGQSA
jgi:aminoglycoside phosphotransferase (APT) family kinase protein